MDKIVSVILQLDYSDPMMILLDTILVVAELQFCFVAAMMTVEEDVQMLEELLLHYYFAAASAAEVVLEKEAMKPHEVEAVPNYLE